MKYLKTYESFSDIEMNIQDILQDCIDIGMQIGYYDPTEFYSEAYGKRVEGIRVLMYAGQGDPWLTKKPDMSRMKKFIDIKPNIEHLIEYMKSIGYDKFWYSDEFVDFNQHDKNDSTKKAKFNFLPNDEDGVYYPYITFFRDI